MVESFFSVRPAASYGKENMKVLNSTAFLIPIGAKIAKCSQISSPDSINLSHARKVAEKPLRLITKLSQKLTTLIQTTDLPQESNWNHFV